MNMEQTLVEFIMATLTYNLRGSVFTLAKRAVSDMFMMLDILTLILSRVMA